MSKNVKWILGIVFGLVLVCGVVAMGLLVFSWINSPMWAFGDRVLPRHVLPWDDMPMRPRLFADGLAWGWLPFGGFLGGLLGLGFLILIVLGIVALVQFLTRSRVAAATSGPQSPPAPLAESAEMAAPARSCPNCQRVVNEDWSHCPYCGTALTPPESGGESA